MSDRSWRFTLANPTEEEKSMIRLWEVGRCSITEEVCPTTGTPHLQGYITWKRTYRLAALKKQCPRAHWEIAKVADWNYELKTDAVPFRIEDNRRVGHRTDIDVVYDAVDAGSTLEEFIATRPALAAIRLFEKLQACKKPRQIEPIEVLWYYGPTGSGKTRAAFDQYPDLYRPLTYKWWDGYVGQETVLIDDFRRDWCKFHELLTLTDVYPMKLEVKGGSTQFRAKRIIITSPFHPRDTYETREDIGQLLRRITEVRHFPFSCPRSNPNPPSPRSGSDEVVAPKARPNLTPPEGIDRELWDAL